MTTTRTSQRRRAAGRLALVAFASICIVAAAAFTQVSPAGPEPTWSRTVEFGCEGVMVVANVRCELGVADAFDRPPSSSERAPWCGPDPDATVYGCAHDGLRRGSTR